MPRRLTVSIGEQCFIGMGSAALMIVQASGGPAMKAAWLTCAVLFLVGCQQSDPEPIKVEPAPTEKTTEREPMPAPQLSEKPAKPKPPPGVVFADDPEH